MRAEGLVRGPTAVVEAVNKARGHRDLRHLQPAGEGWRRAGEAGERDQGRRFRRHRAPAPRAWVELAGNVRLAAEEAAQARAAHNGTLTVLAEKATLFNIHDRLFKEGVIPRTEWDLARISYKEAEANAMTAEAGWRTRQSAYDREAMLSDARAIDQQLDQMRKSEEIQKNQILRAPNDGIVTQCGPAGRGG